MPESSGLSQDLFHCLSLSGLVDQYIQVANLPHEWIFDFFHADSAHHAFDQRARRIHLRSFRNEGLAI